jgi:arylamine N-acetyltransferase
VQTLTVQLPGTQRRMILRNRDYIEDRGDAVDQRTLESGEEVASILQGSFELDIPIEDCVAMLAEK